MHPIYVGPTLCPPRSDLDQGRIHRTHVTLRYMADFGPASFVRVNGSDLWKAFLFLMSRPFAQSSNSRVRHCLSF